MVNLRTYNKDELLTAFKLRKAIETETTPKSVSIFLETFLDSYLHERLLILADNPASLVLRNPFMVAGVKRLLKKGARITIITGKGKAQNLKDTLTIPNLYFKFDAREHRYILNDESAFSEIEILEHRQMDSVSIGGDKFIVYSPKPNSSLRVNDKTCLLEQYPQCQYEGIMEGYVNETLLKHNVMTELFCPATNSGTF